MKTKVFLLFLLIVLFFCFVSYASATEDEDVVDLPSFPEKLAEKLNISLFTAKLLASLILMCIPLFPSMLIAGYFGGKDAVAYSCLIVGLSMMGFCVALTWMPVWIFLIICVLVGIMFAGTMRGWITGRSE